MNAMTALRHALAPLCLGTALLGANAASAEPFASLDRLDQEGFLALSMNLAAATHYKAIAPAEPLSLLGLDLGVELSATEIDRELFDRASDEDYGADQLFVPRLHVHKGLPFGIDVGAFIGTVPETDMTLAGAELRIALLEGGVGTPAIALRGSYSRVEGLESLDLESAALELTISKGFLMLTPYAGAGLVNSDASPLETTGLADESFDQEKVFAGVNLNLIGLNVTAEADRTGELTTFSAKLGIRF